MVFATVGRSTSPQLTVHSQLCQDLHSPWILTLQRCPKGVTRWPLSHWMNMVLLGVSQRSNSPAIFPKDKHGLREARGDRHRHNAGCRLVGLLCGLTQRGECQELTKTCSPVNAEATVACPSSSLMRCFAPAKQVSSRQPARANSRPLTRSLPGFAFSLVFRQPVYNTGVCTIGAQAKPASMCKHHRQVVARTNH